MENSENRRVRMTKLLLTEALISLMRKKSVSEITVKELCEKADINRSSFYRHYNTVYDVYDDIINGVGRDIFVIITEVKKRGGINSYVLIEKILDYISAKKNLFLVLLGDKSNISIGEKLISRIDIFIDTENMSVLTRYCAQFVSAGMTSLIWMWLNDENALSAHEVALMIHMLLTKGIQRAVAINGGTQ